MHELGHSLALQHGGDEAGAIDPDTKLEIFNHKPNYLSIMNYSFQITGLIKDEVDGFFDYSRFELPTIDEGALDELNGLDGGPQIEAYGTRFRVQFPFFCIPDTLEVLWASEDSANGPINWNCDPIINVLGTVQSDVNGAGGENQILTSFNDWANLDFRAGNIGAGIGGAPIEISEEEFDAAPPEITPDQDILISRITEPRVQLSKTVTPGNVAAGDSVAYTTRMLNSDSSAAEEVFVTYTLPPGFSYISDSTTGDTAENPNISGQQLTWGPFVVPPNGSSVTLSFRASVAGISGTYHNNVSGISTNGFVISSGDTAPVVVDAINVDIDIEPGSHPNSINCLDENSVIPVAILTTDGFDATSVDHMTVSFEGAFEMHHDEASGEATRHEEDVDADGDIDLILHFRLADTSLDCESIEGHLVGQTLEGYAIDGVDQVSPIEELEISIDISPLLRKNYILFSERKNHAIGIIYVAILGDEDFAPLSRIDMDSIRFGRTGTEESLLLCLRHEMDLNRDGFRDLACFFRAKETGIQPGDTEAILRTHTVDGTLLIGGDTIQVRELRSRWWRR